MAATPLADHIAALHRHYTPEEVTDALRCVLRGIYPNVSDALWGEAEHVPGLRALLAVASSRSPTKRVRGLAWRIKEWLRANSTYFDRSFMAEINAIEARSNNTLAAREARAQKWRERVAQWAAYASEERERVKRLAMTRPYEEDEQE
jgi:hypothetical protein